MKKQILIFFTFIFLISTASAKKSSYSEKGYFGIGYTSCILATNSKNSRASSPQKYGIQISSESLHREGEIFSLLTFDYLSEQKKKKALSSWLIGFNFGKSFFQFFNPYIGFSAGLKWFDDFDWNKSAFTWKINSGLRFPLSDLSFRAEVSYGSIFGLAGTASVGVCY